ncbi:tetronasin ABC transporter integral membrane protein [Dictyobacter alpinus]|uniref:Tetronasin ABC transporter integral membrane protein n=1 Tax=Dictyobacter alpinus TaxID=2014873 RepID=A0A402BC09_9CHLR|nr:ABC transporter permease [Dictyobacter alpinus]GCE28856.1 tetronasin ABC transporter integral membrane protein [Dictyobacter alpinus]
MNEFIGTGSLLRFMLRRDRIVLPIWILLIALLGISFASSYMQLYPTEAARQAFAGQVDASPAEVVMLGRVLIPSVGGLTAWRFSMASAIIIGIASMLTLIRHTRSEEESGRRELLGAAIIGRQAPLTAALLLTCGADFATGMILAIGLLGLGLPAAGSIALGLSLALVGCFFAAMAGVVAQLCQRAGMARSLVGIAIGLFYVLRMLANAGEANGWSWLYWSTPLGWMRQIHPFTSENWWVLLLFLGSVALLLGTAYAIAARRDLGAGLFSARLGPASAAPGLNGPLALAWRQHRVGLFAWTSAFALLGAVFGYIVQNAESQLPPGLISSKAQVGDSFFTLALTIFVEVVAVYTVQATLQLRSEETNGLAEPILATAVQRLRWAGSHLLIVLLGSTLILATFGFTAGLTHGISTGNVGHELPRILAASLAYVPAVWVLLGITIAFFGLLPRFAVIASWTVLVICVALDLSGELLRANQQIQYISPFTNVPKLLIGQGSPGAIVWLLVIALLLIIAGLASFRLRDLQ